MNHHHLECWNSGVDQRPGLVFTVHVMCSGGKIEHFHMYPNSKFEYTPVFEYKYSYAFLAVTSEKVT